MQENDTCRDTCLLTPNPYKLVYRGNTTLPHQEVERLPHSSLGQHCLRILTNRAGTL